MPRGTRPYLDLESGLAELELDRDRVVAREARRAEIACLAAGRADEAVEREFPERVRADVRADLPHRAVRGDELAAARHAHSEVARMLDRRRADAHVHLARAGPPQEAHDRPAGGPAHDGVVDDDHALAL